MLSNCTVIHVFEAEEMPFHLFKAIGYSMSCPRQYSIRSGDIILCEKRDMLSDIENGNVPLKVSDYYVVTSFFAKEFIAKISTVDAARERITFSFINPDKLTYPDQHLLCHEIRSIHKVDSVQSKLTDVRMEGGAAV